jgi:hypothetical protein
MSLSTNTEATECSSVSYVGCQDRRRKCRHSLELSTPSVNPRCQEKGISFKPARCWHLSVSGMLRVNVQAMSIVACRPFARQLPRNKSYKTAVTRQDPVNSNKWAVFSVRSVPRRYSRTVIHFNSQIWVELVGEDWVNQVARGLLGLNRCELLLREAGSWGRGYFGKPKEGERLPLEAATEQRLVKTWLWTLLSVIVNCKVQSQAVRRSLINPIINPKPIYSHTQITWQY